MEIKDYNVAIDEQNFFDQPVENDWRTFNIWKITTDQGDDYISGCILDHNYFNNYYKMIAVDLGKQQVVDADPKAIQQINFTGRVAPNPVANRTIFFVIEEAKETILDFS